MSHVLHGSRIAARLTMATLLLLPGGCHSSRDDGSGSVDGPAWVYPEYQYVIDQLLLPDSTPATKDYAFDLDHNGVLDNRLGQLAAELAFWLDWGPQMALGEAVRGGALVVLVAIYAQTMQDSAKANLWLFLAQSLSLAEGLQTGFVADDVRGPTDAYFGGKIKGAGGAFGGDHAAATLPLPWFGQAPLRFEAVNIEFDVAGDSTELENGRVGLAIRQSDFETAVLPGIVRAVDAALVAGCSPSGDGGVPADGGADDGGAPPTPGPCGTCTDKGEALRLRFDADGDCRVSEAEVRADGTIGPLLQPDLELSDGSPALSLAIGFHAVSASFSHPPWPGSTPPPSSGCCVGPPAASAAGPLALLVLLFARARRGAARRVIGRRPLPVNRARPGLPSP